MLAMMSIGFPSWSHVHPLIVHFPVALLMVAPLFVLCGLVLGNKGGRPYLITGFLLLVLGTCGALLAGASGDAASEAASKTQPVASVLAQHEEMAETTQIVFSMLTAMLAAILFLPRILKKEIPVPLARLVTAVFLLAYLGGIGVLVNTAHNGGRLVHELGIHGVPVPARPSVADSKGEPQTDAD